MAAKKFLLKNSIKDPRPRKGTCEGASELVHVNRYCLIHMTFFRQFFIALIPFIIVLFEPALAQDPITFSSIEPAATKAEVRPGGFPEKLAVFRFTGVRGTEYTARFSSNEEPAIAIGVGADISKTSYDSGTRLFTVEFQFDSPIVSAAGYPTFDKNDFLLVIDPGQLREFTPVPRPTNGFFPPGYTPPPTPRATATPRPTATRGSGPGGSLPPPPEEVQPTPTQIPGMSPPSDSSPPPTRRPTPTRKPRLSMRTETTECRGPGDPNRSDTSVLAEPEGPPLEARGSFMSTNIYAWCVIPPSETSPFFGFQLSGPSGTKGFFKKKLSAGLVGLLSTLAGKTLEPSNLAIYNGTYEASKSITGTEDGGALISINVKFVKTSTEVSDASKASATSESELSVKAASAVSKTILTSEEEELSLAPKKTTITTKKTALYGFSSDDAAAAGTKVKIQKVSGSKYTTVATATVASDGSYKASINTDTLFNGSSKTTIVSKIVGDQVRQSRSVTLQNRYSSLRR